MTSPLPLVLVERNESITSITLNRKEKRNALNLALLQQLIETIHETEKMADQRALILSGNGSIFCAGMDLYEASQPENLDPMTNLIAKALSTLYNCPLVTIAAVNGAAMAGGAGLMSACDFVVAASNAKIGYPEIQRGLVAAQVSTLLTRQVAWRHVRELLLIGELVDADRAKEMGLVNFVVSPDELYSRAFSLAQQASKHAPEAITETKRILTALEHHSLNAHLRIAMGIHRKARLSDAARQGISDFLSKKKNRIS